MKYDERKCLHKRIFGIILIVCICISLMPHIDYPFDYAFAEGSSGVSMEIKDDSGELIKAEDTTKSPTLTLKKEYDLKVQVNFPQDVLEKKLNIKLEDGLLFVSGTKEYQETLDKETLYKEYTYRVKVDGAFEISKITNAISAEIYWNGELQSAVSFRLINITPQNDKGWYDGRDDVYTVIAGGEADLSLKTAKADSRQGYKTGNYKRRIKMVTVNLEVKESKGSNFTLSLKEGASETGWTLSGSGNEYTLTKVSTDKTDEGFDYLNEPLPIIVHIKEDAPRGTIEIEGTGSITGIDGTVSQYAYAKNNEGKIFRFYVVPKEEDVIVSFRSFDEALLDKNRNVNYATYPTATSVGSYFDSQDGIKTIATTSVGNRGGSDSTAKTVEIKFDEDSYDEMRIKAFSVSETEWLDNVVTFTTKNHPNPITAELEFKDKPWSVLRLCAAVGIETDGDDYFTSLNLHSPSIPKDGFYTFSFYGLTNQTQTISNVSCAKIRAYDDSGRSTGVGSAVVNFQNVYNAFVSVPGTVSYDAGEKIHFEYTISASQARVDHATDNLKIYIIGNIKNAVGAYLHPENIEVSRAGEKLNVIMTNETWEDGRPAVCIDLTNLANGKGKIFGGKYDTDTGSVTLKGGESIKLSYDIKTSRATPNQTLNYADDVILYSADKETGRNNICVKSYGQEYISGRSNEYSKSSKSNTYTIKNNSDVTIRTGSKHETATDYHVFDGSNYVEIGKENSFQIKTDMINTSGKTIKGSRIYIPIPKLGENWGKLMEGYGDFEFPIELVDKVTLSDNAQALLAYNYDRFNISYGINIEPTSNVAELREQKVRFIENIDSSQLSQVNCIKIEIKNLEPQNASSDDEEAYIDSNTFSFYMNAKVDNSASISNGQKDAWRPLYYVDLSTETKYAYGEAIGIMTKTGKVSGYIWEDTDKNGIMDGSESIGTSYSGWIVEAYTCGTYKDSTPIRKTTIDSEGKYEIYDLSGEYDLVVRRPDGKEIALTKLSTNKSGNKFEGVVDENSEQTLGIASNAVAGIEAEENQYVYNIGVLTEGNVLTKVFFKISNMLNVVSGTDGTTYGKFESTSAEGISSLMRYAKPWEKIIFPEVLAKSGYAFLKWVMPDGTDVIAQTYGYAEQTFWAILTETTPAKVEFEVTKAFDGGDGPAGMTYKFKLFKVDGTNNLVEVAGTEKSTTEENRKVIIKDDFLTFKQAGTYIAALHEDKPSSADDGIVEYDENYYIYKFTVVNDSNTLKISKIEDAVSTGSLISEGLEFQVLYNPAALGYNRGDAVKVNTDSNTWTVAKTITNKVKGEYIEMPETGGMGTLKFLGFSMFSAALAVFYTYRIHRKRRSM